MVYDDLNKREEAARDLIEALERLGRGTPASPDFVARVMAGAARLPVPGARRGAWLTRLRGWSSPLGVRLAVAALLVLALMGAVPQYYTWVRAYTMGVPAAVIHEARVQERLWERNFTCATRIDRSSSNYAAILGEQVVMVAWACPSGDVLVTMESALDNAFRRSVWVTLDPPHQSVGLLESMVPGAFAADPPRGSPQTAPMITVLCQQWLPNRFIKRRIELADGRCVDEVLNPRTGEVVERRKAPCDPKCAPKR